ncbi:hypothetical protein SAMN04488057_105354 [Cyclobacterium lianum]|uniref:Uncharacterized protein n=1 Tax=Cyclobacterium lianum TaxID=388280 RepID=A0A1M7NIB9_9BACT|nr:hypothetical protein [Cyclobacterium lianum]SHN03560.1 hypothetical protein SAMN04488057_105354 [Cyclobacterium lianum]
MLNILAKSIRHLAFLGVVVSGNIGCTGSQKGEPLTSDFEPRFVLTDSLVVNYLGRLSILDIKAEGSAYLMHDFQKWKKNWTMWPFISMRFNKISNSA